MPLKTSLKNSQGFTLLELLIVVSILSSIAYLAVDNVAESDSFNKWQRSQYRLENMRQAILGDSSRLVNGQSELSGFVVDIGRLPGCLSELLEAKQCDGIDFPAFTLFEEQMAGGWRGPYLSATHRLGDYDAYRDGWGNKGDSDDKQNFGWVFQSSPTGVNVQTLGADAISVATALSSATVTSYEQLSDYEKDYPKSDRQTLISEHEFQLLLTDYTAESIIPVVAESYIGGLQVALTVQVNCTETPSEVICGLVDSENSIKTCLTISSIVDGALVKDHIKSRPVKEALLEDPTKFTLNGTKQTLSFKFGEGEDTYLPIGRHYAALLVWDSTGNKCGDSYPGEYEIHFPFTVLAGNRLVTLQGVVK